MTARDEQMIRFIDRRIDSVLRRPDAWGCAEAVEAQILLLLEVRRVALAQPVLPGEKSHIRNVVDGFTQFMRDVLPGATPATLASQLEARGRAAELPELLARFVSGERARIPSMAIPSEVGVVEPDTRAALEARLHAKDRPPLSSSFLDLGEQAGSGS